MRVRNSCHAKISGIANSLAATGVSSNDESYISIVALPR